MLLKPPVFFLHFLYYSVFELLFHDYVSSFIYHFIFFSFLFLVSLAED